MANTSSSHDSPSKRPPNGKHEAAAKRSSNGKRLNAEKSSANGKHSPDAKALPNGKHSAQGKSAGSADAALPARDLLAALRALRRGDFSVRLPESFGGLDGQIVATLNEIAQQADELERDAREVFVAVGSEGRTKLRIKRAGMLGGWRHYADDANAALDRLTSHTRNMATVANAVVHGDFSRRVDEEGEDGALAGEFLRHARAMNGMLDQLSSLSGEITR
ncbi:MAG TPA: hypothetical protein VMG12_10680, partial [Polyangiaceae bacterium]|nr:hypothetical protein [Polyangiaceae bacterium]